MMELTDALPFLVLLFLLAVRVPIGFALILAGAFTMSLAGERTFLPVVRIIVDAPRHYTLISIPLFVLAAELFIASGLIRMLFDAGRAWLGHLPGGIANATIAGTMLFAGASGSSAADAAAFSRIGVDGMTDDGFSPGFAASVVASSATLAILIPPSIAMIIYGSLTDTSIGALMFAGVVPGLVLGTAMMVYVGFVSRRLGVGGSTQKQDWAAARVHLFRIFPLVGVLFVILGGFYTGRFTATELSAVAALFALLMGCFFYRTINWNHLPGVFARTAKTTGSILFILIGGTVFGKALTLFGLSHRLVEAISSMELSGVQFLLAVTAALYFLGMFLEGISLNVMTTPILAPIAFNLGIDPVHYGIFLILNIELALISPPVGLHLFIASAASGVKIEHVYRAIWPFIGILFLGILSVVLLPQYILWLPSIVYGR